MTRWFGLMNIGATFQRAVDIAFAKEKDKFVVIYKDDIMKEFHQGVFGGHHSCKVTSNKILRVGFYCPSMFSNFYKEITTCHQCQIFEGKRKLVPLPLNPISVEAPFQQWGLYFIGEINPNSYGKHR